MTPPRRLKLRTLAQCAFDVAAEYRAAEAIETWLGERPGVELVVSCVGPEGWCCVLRRDGLAVAITGSQPSMGDAIERAAQAYDATRPESEYGWEPPPGWSPPKKKS